METSLPPHYIYTVFEIPLILPRSSVSNVIMQGTAQEMSIQVEKMLETIRHRSIQFSIPGHRISSR